MLYKPPVKESTMILWAGPFGLLFIGAIAFILIVRKRASAAPQEEPSAPAESGKRIDAAEARKLLDE